MNYFKPVLGIAAILLTTTAAEARDRWHWRSFNPWADRYVIYDNSDDEDPVYYEEDDSEDVIVLNRRQSRLDDADLWWLEDGARTRLEKRQRTRQQAEPIIRKKQKSKLVVEAPKVKPKKPIVTAKAPKPAPQKLQTASLTKTSAEPTPKTKTIGCTSGAAIVTGYGFAGVTPKACTGGTYAYNAQRGGKNYVIQLTAATGEITDVKKLN
jgi:hypothetical protein